MIKKIALASALACSALGTAQAAAIDGTQSVILSIRPTAALIDLGTTFTFVSSSTDFGTGHLVAVDLTEVITDPFTATNGAEVRFAADWGSFLGRVLGVNRSVNGPNRAVGFYALGTFTPLGVLANPANPSSNFTPGDMSLTFTANQTESSTGGNQAIQAGYTISSPPAPFITVPEPGALALVGMAMVGLALTRRKTAQV